MTTNLYETEIKPLLSNMDNLDLSDTLYNLSESFFELRKASNKQHFLDGDNSIDREELKAEMRRRAIEMVVDGIGIVNCLDSENETEE